MIFEDYAKKSTNRLYSGIKLKLGILSIDEIKSDDAFIKQIDDWLVFNRNSEYYIVVNSKPNNYYLPTFTLSNSALDIKDDPIFFYLRKKDLKPVSNLVTDLPIHPYHQKVIDVLKEPKNPKVKSFWNFKKKD